MMNHESPLSETKAIFIIFNLQFIASELTFDVKECTRQSRENLWWSFKTTPCRRVGMFVSKNFLSVDFCNSLHGSVGVFYCAYIKVLLAGGNVLTL